MSTNTCSKCNKTFSNLGNLNLHLRTICTDKIDYLECEYCHQQFKRQSSLTVHHTVCKIKLAQDNNKEKLYDSLKNDFNTLKEKYEHLTEIHETSEENYRQTIARMETSEENYRQTIARMENEITRLTDILSSLTDKLPTGGNINSNNTSNNVLNINVNAEIIEKLNSITDETFFEYGKELTQSVFLQGLESVDEAF
jgi:hypothetical protein